MSADKFERLVVAHTDAAVGLAWPLRKSFPSVATDVALKAHRFEGVDEGVDAL